MSLPKISHPTFETTLSNLQKVKYRPMLVKEEKILLMAGEGKAQSEIVNAIRQVVNNCLVTPVSNLTTFDMDYLFIKIRAASVSNIIKLNITDDYDAKKQYDIEVDLNKIIVRLPEKATNTVKISDTQALILKYPTTDIYDDESFKLEESADNLLDVLIRNCLDSYSDGDKIVKFRDQPKNEVKDFIDNLSLNVYNDIKAYIGNLPTVFYELKYTNSKGEEKTITLTSISDFFTF